MTYYTRPIEMPKTKRDGLANFVQIIINCLERGEAGEALLKAVDLRDDIDCGNYDSAMADANGYSAIIREAETKHAQAIAAAVLGGHEQGIAAEKTRIAGVLGLM